MMYTPSFKMETWFHIKHNIFWSLDNYYLNEYSFSLRHIADYSMILIYFPEANNCSVEIDVCLCFAIVILVSR